MEAKLNAIEEKYETKGDVVNYNDILVVVKQEMDKIPEKDVETGNQLARRFMEWMQQPLRTVPDKETVLAKLYLIGLRHFKTKAFNFIGGDDWGGNSKIMTFANMDFVFVPEFVQALMVEVGVLQKENDRFSAP